MPPKKAKGDDEGAQAESIIFDYLAKQNRPYSAIDIFNNLHGKVGKTAVVKALASLAAADRIREKEYGKSKIYVTKQDSFPATTEGELDALDKEMETLKASNAEAVQQVRALEAELRELQASLTTEGLVQRLATLQAENAKNEARVEMLRSGTKLVSKEEREAVYKKFGEALTAFRKRKRMCLEMADTIMENVNKRRREFFEELGVETEEDRKIDVAIFAN